MIVEMLPNTRIDTALLQQQKAWLLRHSNEEAHGLVCLIDSLQDYMVDVLGVSERAVFRPADPPTPTEDTQDGHENPRRS